MVDRDALLARNEVKAGFFKCLDRYQFELCRMTHLWKTATALTLLSGIHPSGDPHRSTIDILAVLVAIKGDAYRSANMISLLYGENLYSLPFFDQWVKTANEKFKANLRSFENWDLQWKKMLHGLKENCSSNEIYATPA